MAVSRRTRMSSPERRRAILDAALASFAARGYHGTSIDHVARAAGVSKALIYEHFASKQTLHADLLALHAGTLFARLEANAQRGEAGRERLRGGIEEFFRWVESDRTAFRVLLRDASDPEIVDALAGVQTQAVNVLTALMLADEAAPTLMSGARDAERAIAMLAAQLSGAMQALAGWWDEHREVSREEVIDRAMDFAWLGLERVRAGEGAAAEAT